MERRRNVATRPKPAGVLLLQIAAATAAAVRVYPAACPTDRSNGSRLTESYPTCAQAHFLLASGVPVAGSESTRRSS
jgi:hypothetical protein